MLPTSHYRAYQDFLTLLTEFNCFLVNSEENIAQIQIRQRFDNLQRWFAENITALNSQDLELSISSRWQSVQTEIKRDFKLLSTSVLFLASARKNATRNQKLKNVKDYTTKLINYCQIMIVKDEE